MIIEVTIPQEIVNHLTLDEVVEMNLTGVPVPGGGSGDMTKEIYDPTGVEADAFSMANMVESDEAKVLTKDERDNIETAYHHSQQHHAPLESWPVGSVFISLVDTDPSVMLGYGTWRRFAKGRTLVGLREDDPYFGEIRQESGEVTQKTSGTCDAPIFTGDPLADHQHNPVSAGTPTGVVGSINQSASGAATVATGSGQQVASRTHTHPAPSFTGVAMPAHDHGRISAGTPTGVVSAPSFTGEKVLVVQPSIVVIFWERIE